MEKLKKCPFCGHDAELHELGGELDRYINTVAQCPNCDAGFAGYSASEVLPLWNRRAPIYAPAKPNEVTEGHYWLVTPDGEKTIERIWDRYNNNGLGMESPEGWVAVSEIYELGGVLYSIPPLEVAE